MGTDGNVFGFDTLSLHAGQQPDTRRCSWRSRR